MRTLTWSRILLVHHPYTHVNNAVTGLFRCRVLTTRMEPFKSTDRSSERLRTEEMGLNSQSGFLLRPMSFTFDGTMLEERPDRAPRGVSTRGPQALGSVVSPVGDPRIGAAVDGANPLSDANCDGMATPAVGGSVDGPSSSDSEPGAPSSFPCPNQAEQILGSFLKKAAH